MLALLLGLTLVGAMMHAHKSTTVWKAQQPQWGKLHRLITGSLVSSEFTIPVFINITLHPLQFEGCVPECGPTVPYSRYEGITMASDIETNPGPCHFNLPNFKKGTIIAQLNARSVRNKTDDVGLLLQKSRVEILGISETWHTEFDEIQFPGYDIIRRDHNRDDVQQGGGVALLIRESINYQHLKNICPGVEAVAAEIRPAKSRPYTVCVAYCAPDQQTEFLNAMDTLLANVTTGSNEAIVMGDLNVNLLKESTQKATLQNITTAHNLTQLITEATRLTDETSTPIDHMYTTNSEHVSSSGVIPIGISDHCLTFLTRKLNGATREPRTHPSTRFRAYNKIN